MRRLFATISIVCLSSLALFSQSQPVASSEAKPQIAFHLFSNWADTYMTNAQRGKAIASGVLFGTGSICAAGSIVTYLKGDDISEYYTGSPLNSDLKQNLSLGLGIGAGVLYLSGILVSVSPIKDYRAIYADVFQEKDPEVQEAMAVSVLRYQADQGKERRITSFITSAAVPIITSLIVAGVEATDGPSYGRSLLRNLGNSTWWISGSLISLISKTPEERLYDRYLSTRDALYRVGDK